MKDFIIFIKKYKLSLFVVSLVTFLIYGIKLFCYSITPDTEIIINDYKLLMNGWLSLNRFSLVFIKYIFNLNPFNYHISNILMIIFFIISVFLLCYIFSTKHKEISNIKVTLFSLLIVTSPIYVEQFGFSLQCAEVAISFFIFDIGIYLLLKGMDNNKKIFYIASILCFVEAFGCYQSFVVLYIAIIVYLLVIINDDKVDFKSSLSFIVRSIIILVITLTIYLILSKLIMIIFKIESTSYLSKQILWLNSPLYIPIGKIAFHIIKILFAQNHLYTFSYMLAIIIIFMNIFKNQKNYIYIILNLFVIITPFLLVIFLGNYEVIRSQFTLPIMIAFTIIFMNKSTNKKWNYIVYILTVIFIIQQSFISIKLFSNDYIRYQKDVRLAESILNKVNSNKIIFLGCRHSNVSFTGETLGSSFFEWDCNSEYGINSRATSFIKTLGYDIVFPTLDEINEAKMYSKKLENWPSKNSIKEKESYTIVKLSD